MSVVEQFWKWLIAQLPCVVCKRFEESGEPPSLHHVAEGSGLRSTFAMVPICCTHHQGPRGLHDGTKAFIRMYRPPGDSEYGLLVWMLEDLAGFLRTWLKQLGVNTDARTRS